MFALLDIPDGINQLLFLQRQLCHKRFQSQSYYNILYYDQISILFYSKNTVTTSKAPPIIFNKDNRKHL